MVERDVRRRLPPLNFLVTAEAVARRTSFTAASEELHVTPSAVSHQIRSLEAWLGFPLFHRNPKMVVLTEQGERYLSKVARIIADLETATTEAVEGASKQKTLRIQTTDSFASRWLVHRLPKFQDENPSLAVQIVTFEYTEGFRTTEADIAILYGRGDWPNHVSYLLLREMILPVCHPSIVNGVDGCGFFSNTVLHDDNLGTSWEEWWDNAGDEVAQFGAVDFAHGLRFNHSHLALQAAEKGHGILLASMPLIVDALAENRLTAPFSYQHDTGCGYHLLLVPDTNTRRRCEPLADWLLSQRSIDNKQLDMSDGTSKSI
jgi:LysR family glycine cleavage system transcriptional activator